MPSKKKNRSIKVIFIVVLALVVGSLILLAVYNNIEQTRKRDVLNQADIVLNQLADELHEDYPSVSRSEYCYESEEKLEGSYIYCRQVLLLEERLENETIAEITLAMNKYEFVKTNENINDEKTVINYKYSESGNLICGASLSSFSSNFSNPELRSRFILESTCTQSGLDEFIYPERS